MVEIALEYACGCRDVWNVEQAVEDSEKVLHCPAICVPDDPKYPCQTCTRIGKLCPSRAHPTGLQAYRPVEWTEIKGVRRILKGTEVQPWERDRQKHQSA